MPPENWTLGTELLKEGSVEFGRAGFDSAAIVLGAIAAAMFLGPDEAENLAEHARLWVESRQAMLDAKKS